MVVYGRKMSGTSYVHSQNCRSVEAVPVHEGLLKAQLKLEHASCEIMDQIQDLNRMWAVAGALCSVGRDGELTINV